MPLRLPPLRERGEDIGDLVRHFLRLAAREGLGQKAIETAAIDRLKAHPWPGNVRELENFVRRARRALYTQDTLTPADHRAGTGRGRSRRVRPEGDSEPKDLSELVERHWADISRASAKICRRPASTTA